MSVRIHPIYSGMAWCYLVEGDGGVILIDAGAPRKEELIFGRLQEIGRKDLTLIYITHTHLDHYGSAAAVRHATGAAIAVHEADAGAMARGETPLGSVRLWGHVVKALLPIAPKHLRPPATVADVVVHEGDRLDEFGVAAEVFHTPGHTPGSTSLLVDGCHLFVGDLVSNMVWPHPQLLYADDWQELRASIRRLQGLAPEWVYTGHGKRPMNRGEFARIKAR